jgi:hypothetical protein
MWNWGVNNIKMQHELNLNLNLIQFQFNQIQFNNCVKIKFHWKKRGCKLGLTLKRHNPKRHLSMSFHLGMS